MFKIKKGNQSSSHAGTFFLCCKVVFHFASHKEVCFQFVCLHDDLGSPKEKIKMPGQNLQLSTTPDHYRKMMMESKTIKNSMCGKKIEFLTLLHLVQSNQQQINSTHQVFYFRTHCFNTRYKTALRVNYSIFFSSCLLFSQYTYTLYKKYIKLCIKVTPNIHAFQYPSEFLQKKNLTGQTLYAYYYFYLL